LTRNKFFDFLIDAVSFGYRSHRKQEIFEFYDERDMPPTCYDTLSKFLISFPPSFAYQTKFPL